MNIDSVKIETTDTEIIVSKAPGLKETKIWFNKEGQLMVDIAVKEDMEVVTPIICSDADYDRLKHEVAGRGVMLVNEKHDNLLAIIVGLLRIDTDMDILGEGYILLDLLDLRVIPQEFEGDELRLPRQVEKGIERRLFPEEIRLANIVKKFRPIIRQTIGMVSPELNVRPRFREFLVDVIVYNATPNILPSYDDAPSLRQSILHYYSSHLFGKKVDYPIMVGEEKWVGMIIDAYSKAFLENEGIINETCENLGMVGDEDFHKFLGII